MRIYRERDKEWDRQGHPNRFVAALDLHPRGVAVVVVGVTFLAVVAAIMTLDVPLSRLLPVFALPLIAGLIWFLVTRTGR